MEKLKIVLMASGNGSNVQAILDAINSGLVNASAKLVLCNRPNAYVLERAENSGVESICVDHTLYKTREEYDAKLIEIINQKDIDLIVLAGYMRLLSESFIEAFRGKIINIHPSLLPSFSGTKGISDSYDWGVKLAGCTVHLVDEIMDNGAIIAQATTHVDYSEDLSDLEKRIHKLEHRIYPQVIEWFASGRIKICERRVYVEPSNIAKAKLEEKSFFSPALEQGF